MMVEEEIDSEQKEIEGNRKETTLTRKQREAIPYLIGARSLEQGRKEAKVGQATLWKWLKQDAFKSELEATREEVIRQAIQTLKGGITRAIDELLNLVEDKNKLIRIRACEKVVDFFLKVKEIDELEGRLESIERIILEKKTYRGRSYE
jgi:hypothetical protein